MTVPAAPTAGRPRAPRGVFVPRKEPPTRHPRSGGLGTARPGERLTVRFTGVAPDGAATVRLGAVHLSVPFGVPGEEAIVEVTKGGRRAEGRLIAILRKSSDIQPHRCHHFGRCGGCQWQHVVPELQRRLKTRLVKDYLKEHAGVRRDLVADTLGGDAWGYRNVIRVEYAEQGGELVLGYHAARSPQVLDITQCPVQHPTNERLIQAARDAVSDLRLPICNRETGAGGVRGVLGLTSFATGQALLAMSTTAPLADPTTVVHALIDQIPGLVGILNAIQPAPAPGLLGPRLRLLWGRDHVDEEIAGFLLRVRFSTDMPANPQAMSVLVDAVIRAADMRPSDVAVDLHAHTPLLTMAMARAGDGATGAVRGRQAVEDAWYAAKWNGVTNALFTTRDGAGVLAAAAGRRRPEVVAVSARGQGLDPDTIAAVAAAQVPRVVYLARSVATCARDLVAWQQAGYAPALVQPVDLLPQTSHVHLVAALRRRG